jgi:hypothetical protein
MSDDTGHGNRTHRRHVRDKSVIDHLVDSGSVSPTPDSGAVHGAETATGQPVEEQVRKEWSPEKEGGLPTF